MASVTKLFLKLVTTYVYFIEGIFSSLSPIFTITVNFLPNCHGGKKAINMLGAIFEARSHLLYFNVYNTMKVKTLI